MHGADEPQAGEGEVRALHAVADAGFGDRKHACAPDDG